MSTTTTTCPAWCTLPAGHDADDDERQHRGPTFGRYYASQCDRGDGTRSELVILDRIDDGHESVQEIRAAASDLLLAADWLAGQEAQR